MYLKSWLVAYLFNFVSELSEENLEFETFCMYNWSGTRKNYFLILSRIGLHGVLHEDLDFTRSKYIILTIFIVSLCN